MEKNEKRRFARFLLRLSACVALLCGFLSVPALAQVTVEAHMDTAAILIGEQVRVRVKCAAGAGQDVRFPEYQPRQEITPGVEVVAAGAVDTARDNSGRSVALTRYYTVTSFDSALYALPPFEVQVDGKSYKSRGTLGLKVNTVPVDTVHVDDFPGPHDVVEIPFAFSWRLVLLSLLALVLGTGAVALALRLADPRGFTRRVVIHPPVPAHVTAIEGIERIKKEYNPDSKARYMLLTDTLRSYIESRFGFSAREMTSQEIVAKLSAADDGGEALGELRSVLETADLVKFAKHDVTMDEQDRSFVEAMSFVQTTKIVPAAPPQPRVEYVSLSGGRQRRVRLMMAASAWALALSACALTLFVAADAYGCFL